MKIISPLKLHKVNYIESSSKLADVRELIKNLSPDTKEIYIIDPNDYLLRKELKNLVMKIIFLYMFLIIAHS